MYEVPHNFETLLKWPGISENVFHLQALWEHVILSGHMVCNGRTGICIFDQTSQLRNILPLHLAALLIGNLTSAWNDMKTNEYMFPFAFCSTVAIEMSLQSLLCLLWPEQNLLLRTHLQHRFEFTASSTHHLNSSRQSWKRITILQLKYQESKAIIITNQSRKMGLWLKLRFSNAVILSPNFNYPKGNMLLDTVVSPTFVYD